MSALKRPNSRRRHCRPTTRLLFEKLEDRQLLATFPCSLDVTTTVDAGAGSLREAISCANNNGLDDVIVVPAGTYTLAGDADDDANLGGDLDLTEFDHSITIRGAGADQTIISAGGIDRGVHVGQGVTAVLEGLSIIDGLAESGAGITNFGKLTLNDVFVRDNVAANEGGGIRSFDQLTLNRSVVQNNAVIGISGATVRGGGIAALPFSQNPFIQIVDSTIAENTVSLSGGSGFAGSAEGGAIASFMAPVTILHSVIRDNTVTHDATGNSSVPASAMGGGIALQSSTATLIHSDVRNNLVSNSSPGGGIAFVLGGGIYLTDGSLTIEEGSSVVGNTVVSDSTRTSLAFGGGVYFSAGSDSGSQMTVRDSNLSENAAQALIGPAGSDAGGGGIHIVGGVIDIARTMIAGNQVRSNFFASGGAIRAGAVIGLNSATLTLSEAVIVQNNIESQSTSAGAGISATSEVTVNISRTTIESNRLVGPGSGAGVSFSGAEMTVIESSISGNVIDSPTFARGGGVATLSSLTLINSTVSGNTIQAASNATSGGIDSSGNPVLIRNSTITGNRVVHGNAGGLSAPPMLDGTPAVTIHNTIVAGNFAGAEGTSPSDIVGTLDIGTEQSPNSFNNLVGNVTTSGGLIHGVNGNQVGNNGVGTIDINTVLNPTLVNNGGPTKTHALVTNSPALNAGSNAQALNPQGQALATDQRGPGFPRLVKAAVDIGAFEDVTCLTVVNTNDSGSGSFRDAIDCANASIGVLDAIRFLIPGIGGHTIRPASVLPTITDPVIIDGYSQPGARPNTNAIDDPDLAKRVFNGNLLIELNGQNAGAVNGLTITAGGSTIRGLVLNGFTNSGMLINGGDNNIIAGNIIGIDATAAAAVSNGRWGVMLMNGASGNVIGSDGDGNIDATERNIIGGNGFGGVGITGAGSDNNVVAGNFIGVNGAGNAALGNANRGVDIFSGAKNNRIGTNSDGVSDVAERNLISGNKWTGVGIYNAGTDNNTVAGNWIGLNLAGTSGLPNALGGVSVFGGATGNVIGGTTPGSANSIAFNTLDGVAIVDNGTINNPILGNSIFSNGDLGIDLGPTGLTANDSEDADTGSNHRQNFPEIDRVVRNSTGITLSYKVDSLPTNSSYPLHIEFFKADADGEEGQTYLGFDIFTEDDFGQGLKSIFIAPATALALSDKIVATATDWLPESGPANTSEFSPAVQIASPWHNSKKAMDVRGGSEIEPDNHIDAGDALAIINYINAFNTEIPDDAVVGLPFGFLDVTNDNNVAPDDALTIINAINAGVGGEGEGPGFGVQGSGSPAEGSLPLSNDLIGLLAEDAIKRLARRKRV